MSMPLNPPYAVTASYMKQQYDQNYDICTPYGSTSTNGESCTVFDALVSPPATGVAAANADEAVAYGVGFIESSHTAQDQVETLTISASGGKFKLGFGGEATPALAWNSSAATIQSALLALEIMPAPQVETPTSQTVSFSGTAASGTWAMSFGSATTPALAFDVSLAGLQGALESLSTVGSGGIASVTGTPGSNYVITFGGNLALTTIDVAAVDVALEDANSKPVSVSVTANLGTGITALSVSGTPATANSAGVYTITYSGPLADNFIEPSWEPALAIDPSALTPKGSAQASVTITTQGEPTFSVWPLKYANQQYDGVRDEWDYGSGNNFAYTPEET